MLATIRRRVRRLRHEPGAADVGSRGPRQAHLHGFGLHANVWIVPNDRVRLELRCRSLLRPPVAQDRLHAGTGIVVQRGTMGDRGLSLYIIGGAPNV